MKSRGWMLLNRNRCSQTNMSSLSSVFLLSSLLLVFILSVCDGQYPGGSCTVDGTRGICRPIKRCTYVSEELQKGKPPRVTCGYESHDPIVCCPTGELTTRRPTTNKPPVRYRRGGIAKAKCEEYTKAVHIFQVPPPQKLAVNEDTFHIFIVGGKKAAAGEFPHMAAIGFNSEEGIKWNCGGTLISRQFVMTAAHCLFTTSWGSASWVRLGDLNLKRSDDNTQSQDFRIVQRIKHPNYKWPSLYHDIGLVKLEKEVLFTAWIKPSCLPHSLPDASTIQNATATGWGLVNWADETGSSDLLKVTVNLVPHASCNSTFGTDTRIERGVVNDWQICAGEKGKDTCQGDSGGPLSVPTFDQKVLTTVIGITSLGRLCGEISPGVYTRVYHYLPWIENVVWPELL